MFRRTGVEATLLYFRDAPGVERAARGHQQILGGLRPSSVAFASESELLMTLVLLIRA